jgi:predicted DNA-binding transcriptional regulator AlpA
VRTASQRQSVELDLKYPGISMSIEPTQFQPLLLNVNQVAALLGCHRNTIWNRARRNLLPPPIKWEGKTVWRRQDIEDFVDSLAA